MFQMVAAAAIGLAVAQLAVAQREGPRRGGRGFPLSAARLATADEVQAALKLSDEQKDKIAAINDELRDDVREAFQSGGGLEQMQELNEKASAKLAEVLDEGQQKRLMGVLVQLNGPGALMEPAVVSELKLTEEQKARLAEIRQTGMQSFRDAFQQMREQNLSRDEIRAKFDELRADTDKKLLAELTPEQRAQLESLKGEPIEIDIAQFRGPGGGSRGQDGDRDQDRDREEDGGESRTSESPPSGN
jgi:Spy/CpxP family protein refolding chaperone